MDGSGLMIQTAKRQGLQMTPVLCHLCVWCLQDCLQSNYKVLRMKSSEVILSVVGFVRQDLSLGLISAST